jgi:hypothetical protein
MKLCDRAKALIASKFDRSEPPVQSGESEEVSSGLAPVLVLDVLARRDPSIPDRPGMSGPEQASCRPEPFRWVRDGEFCMDNIEWPGRDRAVGEPKLERTM